MKKIYSFVLMAAMLLIGTNVKAVVVSTWDALASELEGEATEITLGDNIAMPEAGQISITGGKVLTLNLSGHNITYSGTTTYYPIVLDGGNLTINGAGTISSTFYAVIKVVGSYEDVANYSVLTVNQGVNMTCAGSYAFVVAQAKKPGTNSASKHGYGIVINFDGYLAATGEEGTAFWVLGNIKDTEGNIPQITIGEHAHLVGATDGLGYYAGGYANNVVEGKIEGGTGIYAKAGEITIDGGTVLSNATTHSDPQANGNGFTGGLGCAIVSDSHNGYAGEMEITITGNATLGTTADGGYAIQEVKTNAEESNTESLVIESGTINGNLETTAELHDNIVLNGTITGGTYSAGSNISNYIDPNATELVETTPGSGVYTVKVAVNVTVNAAGLSTFSSKKKVQIPAGLVAYEATAYAEDKLTLHQVAAENDILPANCGVILYGANGTLNESSADATATIAAGNLLRPATAFDAAVEAGDNIYVLHGSELWVYDGDEFPANKAFLHLDLGNNAPARIRLVFDAAEGVENVEVEAVKAEKFIENGQIFIKRGENIYNVQGQIVK